MRSGPFRRTGGFHLQPANNETCRLNHDYVFRAQLFNLCHGPLRQPGHQHQREKS